MIYDQMVSKYGFDPLRPRVVLEDGAITAQKIVVRSDLMLSYESLIVSEITAEQLANRIASLLY